MLAGLEMVVVPGGDAGAGVWLQRGWTSQFRTSSSGVSLEQETSRIELSSLCKWPLWCPQPHWSFPALGMV